MGLVVEIVGISGSMADLAKAEKVGLEKEEEGQRLIEGASIVDFDALCSNVASQNQGKWRLLDEEEGGLGGVFRMWEGEVLDCFDDRRIAVESLCCPCYRFGKNMRQAGLGSCFIQGTVYFLLAISAFVNCIAFIVTRRRCFLYLAVAFTISVGTYLGFFRTKMRSKFNIRGHESFLDDCVYHLVCPCCAISQETRTLEINNVQGGTWHGRGDTICIGTLGEGGKAFVELHPPHPVSVHFDETSSTAKDQGDIIKC